MRHALRYTVAATLVAGAAAAAAGHQHGHQHFHAKKDAATRAEKREADNVVEYVVAATETVYELGGELLDTDEAKDGIDQGNFIVVGETTPTFTLPPPAPTTSSAADLGAKFIESKSEEPITTSTTSTTSKPPPPPKTSSPPPPPPSPPKKDKPAGSIDDDFPSGEIDCSDFPSEYGAVPLEWLGFSKWSGIQRVPDFSSSSSSIFEIHTGISGDDCEPGSMCTYACPPGYYSTQWPKAQGSTRESIGGLFCNSDGKLELTREGHDKICEKGQGGVSIKNELDEVVNTCQTIYPGTESMVIPNTAEPGETIEILNPLQTEFMWGGSKTTAQYYVNKAGYTTEEACCWNSPIDPEGAGNWSPINIGAGKDEDGITYLSIFFNSPTSTADLGFNIEIKGDVNGKCSFVDGQFSGGGNGCTSALRDGGKATFRFF